jgi:uncharacterized membrane protein
MPGLSIYFGIVLILLGLTAYIATGMQSVTALIPAFLGILILIFGYLGKNEKFRKHSMHAVLVLALLGLLGTVSGIPKLFSYLGGTEIARPSAVLVQSIMAILCLAFLGLGIKSFMDARKS